MNHRLVLRLFVLLALLVLSSACQLAPGASPAPTALPTRPLVTPATVAAPTAPATRDAGLPAAPRTPASAMPTPAPARPNVLRAAMDAPKTLDPALASDYNSLGLCADIFSGLVTHDEKLDVIPELAEKWETADAKTWTFRLRKDAKFHDGKPITARDVKYSLERATDPALKSPTAALYLGDIVGVKEKLAGKATEVTGVKVVDDATVQITLDAPKSYLLAKLAHPVAFVVDPTNVSQIATQPNGAGPFAVKEYAPNQRIVLARHAAYVGAVKPSLDQVTFRFDVTQRLAVFAAGDLDLVAINVSEAVEAGNAPALKKDAWLQFGYIAFNTRKPPFDDVKVRQAFALTLARDKIPSVANGTALAHANLIPAVLPGGVLLTPTVDAAKAKQLLAESKYKSKLPDVVWTTSSATGSVPLMAAAFQDALGVKVTVQKTEFAAMQKSGRESAFQMLDMGMRADFADPYDFFVSLVRANGSLNYTGYANPAVDKLLDQAAAEKDPAARAKLYQQIESLARADAPLVASSHFRVFGLAQPYVKSSGPYFAPLHFIPPTRFLSIQ